MPAQKHPIARHNAVAAPGALRTVGVDLERYDGSAWKKLNAFDAVSLAANRGLNFSGDMTGSALTDWSGDVSVSTTIDPDSHAHRRPFFLFGGDNCNTSNGGWTGLNVTWNAHDPHGCQSGQSAVCRVPGWWYVGYEVYFADNATGQAIAEMWNFDPNFAYRSGGASDGAGRWGRVNGGAQWSDGNKAAQVVAWQNSGGNRLVWEWYQFGIWICE